MMDGLKSSRGKKNAQPTRSTSLPGNASDVDQRQSTSRIKNFFKSFKSSSVVSKGQQLQDSVNQRNPVPVSVTKSIREIASEILNFIPANKYAEINPLVNRLVFSEVPATLDQLETFVDIANELYASVDYKLQDSSETGVKYQENLSNWRSDFKKEIYTLRDELIQKEEGGLVRFGLENQFRKLHPGAPIPSLFSERQKQLGVIVFGDRAPNDCGVFAAKLLGELEGATMSSLWEEIERGTIKDDQLKVAFRDMIRDAPRMDTFKYRSDPSFAYGHHAKTSIGSHAGKIYSYEAHVGKPFILAPELREFDSLDAYLETTDEYIDRRYNSGPANKYGEIDLATTDIPTIKKWIKSAAMQEAIVSLGRKGV